MLDLGELKIKLPELGRIGARHVAAQKIASFAPPGLAQLLGVEPVAQGRGLVFAPALVLDLDDHMARVAPGGFLGGADGLVQVVALERLFCAG